MTDLLQAVSSLIIEKKEADSRWIFEIIIQFNNILFLQNEEWKKVGYWSRSRSGLSLQPGKIRWAGDTMQPPSDEGDDLIPYAI